MPHAGIGRQSPLRYTLPPRRTNTVISWNWPAVAAQIHSPVPRRVLPFQLELAGSRRSDTLQRTSTAPYPTRLELVGSRRSDTLGPR